MKKEKDLTHHEAAVRLIFKELLAAEEKHPGWPDDLVHAVAIITEEVGEAMIEAIDLTFVNPNEGSVERLRKELAQAGAMCLRALLHLPEGEGQE